MREGVQPRGEGGIVFEALEERNFYQSYEAFAFKNFVMQCTLYLFTTSSPSFVTKFASSVCNYKHERIGFVN
jgi:hypothetical protein